ncbi:MAG: OmpH family outer membrane protein [Flavobacteriales bacterium]|jgi:outer membrane protein|nr:OmpH family outer membrane protein [Flavobacteriales bacterium]
MKPARHILLALAVPLLLTADVAAQRIAFVNTRYILDQMPDYGEAQKELDRNSKRWQTEIDDRYDQIKRMREAYNAESILLTEEMKRLRMEDIEAREREARDLQKRRFGPQGDLFKKRQELIQPIQDRVYEAIKEVAGTSYVGIFDLAAQGGSLLFASEKYDRSDQVLRKLGIRPGENKGDDRPSDEEFGMPPEDGGGKDGGRDGGRDGSRSGRGTSGGGGRPASPR